MSKGKGRAGKQGVRSKKKGKESATKRARMETEVEDKGSESDDNSEDASGGENVGEKGEKPGVSLFSYLKLTLLCSTNIATILTRPSTSRRRILQQKTFVSA